MANIPQEYTVHYIDLSIRPVSEKDGTFTAFCDELGIGTCALTEDAAIRRLKNTITLILDQATERRDILTLLEDRGISLHSNTGAVFMAPPGWFSIDSRIGPRLHSGYIIATDCENIS